MRKLPFIPIFVSLLFFTACNKGKIKNLETEIATKDDKIALLEQQIQHLQGTNSSLLDRMADLSIVSRAGAESINESLKSLSQQYDFIQDLTTKMQSKDSLNLALVMNLKRSLADINDDDVQVEVRGGLVHVSISDKMLFQSGSARINSAAQRVLGKIANILGDHNDLELIVEGHTDDVPIHNSCMEDNWDLSVKRATSVVRALEEEHYVDPARMTAAGRSEFKPKADNGNATGRSQNRRTEIVITPKLDQFFKLLEGPGVKK